MMVEAVLDRDPVTEDGRTYWRIRKFTWGKGVVNGSLGPSPGQVYAVDVEIAMGATTGATIGCKALVCMSYQKDVTHGIEHAEHTDACRFALAPDTHRAWYFLDARDAILAALRWDADDEPEPFGWTRALDGTGRVRPNGDPLREMIGGEAVVQ